MNQRNREEGKLPQPLLASKPLSAWEQSDEKSPLFRPWCFLEEKNIHRIKLSLLILSHLHVILTDSLKTQSNPVTLETCGQRVMTLNYQTPNQTTAHSTGPPLQLVSHFWIVKFDIECNSTILFDFWFISFFPRTCIIFILGSKPPLGVCITSLTVQWSKSAILGNLRIVITRVIKDYAYDYHTKKSFPKDTIT